MRGGFPESFLASDALRSLVRRQAFIRTRDIPQPGPRIPATTFRTMLAPVQGGLLNAAQPARGLAVDGKTVFYRTAAGAEIDLLLEIPGNGIWAIDIKRGLSARPEKGFFSACEDVKPDKRFVVNSGAERYSVSEGVETIGLQEMAAMPAGL